MELARFGGLRSSSERERLMGRRGWGAVVLLLRWVLWWLEEGLVLVCFGFAEVEASREPQDGTGGRFRLGEAMAIFLLACWPGVVGGNGVDQSVGDCFVC